MRCFYFSSTHKALNVYITMSKGHIPIRYIGQIFFAGFRRYNIIQRF